MLSELRRKAPDSRIHAVAGEGTRALFARAPVAKPFHPGARSEAEIGDFLVGLGLERMDQLRIGPDPSMALLDFVEKIVSGELSYIWNVSAHVGESCLPRLKEWSEKTLDLE
jgi:hypothetical protein